MRPIRILHVVHKLDRAGMETWLLHTMRHLDRDRFQMDFVVHTAEPGAYDREIRTLGGRIFVCTGPHNQALYAVNFVRILRAYGPYDVVHSHLQYFSGIPMALARLTRVPMRIAHSHLDTSAEERDARPVRREYLRAMKWLIRTQATHLLSTSEVAADALFGTTWRERPNARVLYCGLDFGSFDPATDVAASRAEFGLSEGALVVGHVGRFEDQKNHAFLVEMFDRLRQREPNARLLLIGEGPLRPAIERLVARRGLQDQIIFTGARDDVAGILRSVVDVFAFPSKFEGLGLALVEAQAAGLPCVVSDRVPAEAVIAPELVAVASLDGTASWVEGILSQARRKRSAAMRQRAFERAVASPFSARTATSGLTAVYQSTRTACT